MKVNKKYINEISDTSIVEESQIEMFVEKRNFTFTPKKSALNNPYSIVSLFSGCGGMDLGFHKEGF